MDLSKRLKAIAGMISPGSRVADIGTDHAYLPIVLVGDQTAVSAIASDISPASADKARQAVIAAGLSDRISVRQADGLDGIQSGEADTVVISGMGGPLIISILASSGMLLREMDQIIVSPQSEVAMVREWLSENGFEITDEKIVRERGKFYMIIKSTPADRAQGGSERVRPDKEAIGEEPIEKIDRAAEMAYGPLLIRRKDPMLAEFLEQEIGRIGGILEKMQTERSAKASERRNELISEKERACAVLKYMNS